MLTKLKKKIAYGRQIKKLKRLYSTMNRVGSNVYICPGYNIACAKNVTLENDVWIGWNSYISADGGVTIKRGTILSRNIQIWTSNHNYDSDGMETIPYDRNFVRKPCCYW